MATVPVLAGSPSAATVAGIHVGVGTAAGGGSAQAAARPAGSMSITSTSGASTNVRVRGFTLTNGLARHHATIGSESNVRASSRRPSGAVYDHRPSATASVAPTLVGAVTTPMSKRAPSQSPAASTVVLVGPVMATEVVVAGASVVDVTTGGPTVTNGVGRGAAVPPSIGSGCNVLLSPDEQPPAAIAQTAATVPSRRRVTPSTFARRVRAPRRAPPPAERTRRPTSRPTAVRDRAPEAAARAAPRPAAAG